MMVGGNSGNLTLPLKEGDTIKTEIQSVDVHGARGDSEPWKNVNDIEVVKSLGSVSLNPGKEIYVTVREIENGTAKVEQKRAAYTRKCLPGDSISVSTTEPVRSSICRGTTDDYPDLEKVLVLGAGPQAEVEATIEKMRDGRAFAVPDSIIEEGIVPGREILAKTNADSTTASTADGGYMIELDSWVPVATEVPVKITELGNPMKGEIADWRDIPQIGDILTAEVQQGSDYAQLPGSPLSIDLPTPALGSGPVEIRLTDVSKSAIKGEIEAYPVSLPEAGDTVEVDAMKGQQTAEFTRGEMTFNAQLEHALPVSGTAQVEIDQKSGSEYRATLQEYKQPSLKPGKTFLARVSKRHQQATTTIDDREVVVKLTKGVHKAGKATVRIRRIEGKIYGTIEGEVQIMDNDYDGPDVDITDVSKL